MANIYRVVKDSDGRDLAHIIKEETAADPQFIVDLQAANTGSTIQTLTEEQGSTIEIGRLVEADGTVGLPTTETDAEKIEGRFDRLKRAVLRSVASPEFHSIKLSVEPQKATIYEAWIRAAYYRGLVPSNLASDAIWNPIEAALAVDWINMVRGMNNTAQNEGGWPTALTNGLHLGTMWKLPVYMESNNRYWPTDPAPGTAPTYTFEQAHKESYEELLISTRNV